jgi:hypothetical protein
MLHARVVAARRLRLLASQVYRRGAQPPHFHGRALGQYPGEQPLGLAGKGSARKGSCRAPNQVSSFKGKNELKQRSVVMDAFRTMYHEPLSASAAQPNVARHRVCQATLGLQRAAHVGVLRLSGPHVAPCGASLTVSAKRAQWGTRARAAQDFSESDALSSDLSHLDGKLKVIGAGTPR